MKCNQCGNETGPAFGLCSDCIQKMDAEMAEGKTGISLEYAKAHGIEVIELSMTPRNFLSLTEFIRRYVVNQFDNGKK